MYNVHFYTGMKLRGKDKGKPLEAKASGTCCLSNPFHFIHPSIRCLRWQEEVGRFWAKSSRHVLSLQTIIPGVDMMRDYFSL